MTFLRRVVDPKLRKHRVGLPVRSFESETGANPALKSLLPCTDPPNALGRTLRHVAEARSQFHPCYENKYGSPIRRCQAEVGCVSVAVSVAEVGCSIGHFAGLAASSRVDRFGNDPTPTAAQLITRDWSPSVHLSRSVDRALFHSFPEHPSRGAASKLWKRG